MKVILIRDSLTKTISKTLMVNDDVVMTEEDERKLKDYGFYHTVCHPVYMKDGQALSEEIDDICGS